MANDWIKLYRKLKDSPIWKHLNSRQRDIYINILLMANYTPKEWFDGSETIKVEAGEFITSLPSIKKNCSKEVTIQNIRTCLLILEKAQFLTCKSTNKWRKIKVLNWAKYQGVSCELTGELTDDQQATNRHLTATKEYKEIKNIKNNILGRFTPPTPEQVKAYCLERNNGVDWDKWFNFYSAKGWMVGKNKMKDWKAAVRTWEEKKIASYTEKELPKVEEISEEQRLKNIEALKLLRLNHKVNKYEKQKC